VVYILVGEVFHSFGLDCVGDAIVVGVAFKLILIFLRSFLLCFLLDEIVELLAVELFEELVLGGGRRSGRVY
jgi:hypothetical protein